MERKRMHYPLRYRRARSLLYVVGLFWLWLWFGSGALLDGLHHAPLHAALVVYGIAVVIVVSIPAALLAGARMVLERPRLGAVVIPLPLARKQPRGSVHWRYGAKAS